jgi:ADP-heptose:LPS heptosyltransferase
MFMPIHYLNSLKKIMLLPVVAVLRLIGQLSFKRKGRQAIVVFYTGKLGDMVCLTPVLQSLKTSRPDTELIIYARGKFLDIWHDDPYIDKAIGYNHESEASSLVWIIREWRRLSCYRIVAYFNLVNNLEGGIFGLTLPAIKHYSVATRLDGKLQRLLYPYYSIKEYKFDRSIKEFYFELLHEAGFGISDRGNEIYFFGDCPEVEKFISVNCLEGKLIIGAIISSGKDYKVWPKEYWIELIKKLDSKYRPIYIFFGLNEDEKYLEEIQKATGAESYLLLDKSLKVLPYYLRQCKLFVSVDTGLLYIADALRVPVVDILGPCDDNNQRPENNYRLVTNRQVCRPQCKMLYNAGINVSEVEECFASLSPDQVLVACEELLSL